MGSKVIQSSQYVTDWLDKRAKLTPERIALIDYTDKSETIRDGWLHTGDIAKRDEDGCYSILGRSREMFISGGENVYPAEIESILLANPFVMEAAVVGVPHDTWGEVGRAFLVVADGYSEGNLRTYIAERLAKYKLPRSYVLLDAMPLTAIGKIDKKLLTTQETSV